MPHSAVVVGQRFVDLCLQHSYRPRQASVGNCEQIPLNLIIYTSQHYQRQPVIPDNYQGEERWMGKGEKRGGKR